MILPERPRAICFLDMMTSYLERKGHKRSPEVQVLSLDDKDFDEFVETFVRYRLFIHQETPTLVWNGYIFHLVRYVPTDNAIPSLVDQVMKAIEN